MLIVGAGCMLAGGKCWAQQVDSVQVEIEEIPEFLKQEKGNISPADSAINAQLRERVKTQKSAMRYVLDKRYRAEGDSMDRHWYDNLFLQVGAGVEQMMPPANNYHFNALTTSHIGVGLQLNRLNTVRLQFHVGMGYQQEFDHRMTRYGVKVEHLFDLSSYFGGYQPTRLVSVSTVIGVGGQFAGLNNYLVRPQKQNRAFEGHGGLQVRFYTGPHGYFNIEPYVGVATNNYDLGGFTQNWRKVDFFYGVNANYVYYFTNHLTRAARQREIRKVNGSDEFRINGNDTLLQSWQSPWFTEFSKGIHVMDVPELGLMETLGSSSTISVGKWFSPVIGLRASAIMRSGVWRKEQSDQYVVRMNTQYLSGGLEAMVNPFGLSKNFQWDGKAGANLLAGMELGFLMKKQTGHSLRCWSEAYTVGTHLWLRLADGLQVFLEPRFIHNVYRIPYSNVDWGHRFTENSYGLNIGLTTTQIAPKYRKSRDTETEEGKRDYHMTVGVGGGFCFMPRISTLDTGQGLPLNVNGHATYHFDYMSGVRLGLDYMLLPAVSQSSFYDYNMEVPDMGYAPVARQGLWSHTYYLGQASLAYHANLTNACAGYRRDRLFNMEAYLGCGVAFLFGENSALDKSEQLREGHEVRLANEVKSSAYFSVVGGVTLSARLSPCLSLALTPQISYIPKLNMPAIQQSKLKVVENINVGVQYNF